MRYDHQKRSKELVKEQRKHFLINLSVICDGNYRNHIGIGRKRFENKFSKPEIS
jgi:hypothetical protein